MGQQSEQRRSQRLRLRIPIRVIGFALGKDHFSEDTVTVEVNREGALIKLNQKVVPKSDVRIINLESYKEADFHVVGPSRMEAGQISEWGVEYIDKRHNIWGMDFPAISNFEEQEGVLLECRACHKQELKMVSQMEVDALNSTGILAFPCDNCKKLTYWNYADPARRPAVLPPADLVSPPDAPKDEKGIEKRIAKRMGMKMAILVRNAKGVEEITKTEDVSKGGVAVALSMDLAVGDLVTIVCPYSGQGQRFDQKADVRRRASFTFNDRRIYGFRYIR
jgi:PilZ domain-containing protein